MKFIEMNDSDGKLVLFDVDEIVSVEHGGDGVTRTILVEFRSGKTISLPEKKYFELRKLLFDRR